MERLQKLLRDYIVQFNEDFNKHEWTRAFADMSFPVYWKSVFTIANELPKNSNVVEIGSGFGFVTSIFNYLGYSNIVGYEYDALVCHKANNLLRTLFNVGDQIKPERFVSQKTPADILVLVNCAYADDCRTKEEYKSRLYSYFEKANRPNYYILEVIDSSYMSKDSVFPDHIRLSFQDIKGMFPGCEIQSWPTYQFPKNKKSKTLYLIISK